jgi:predicted MFS family arabinose efflux permease
MVAPVLLLLANALLGVNNAFWQPVRLALIPRLVPVAEVTTAIALMSVLANVARIAGPMAAAPVIVFGGVELAFALNAVSYIAVVTSLGLMKLEPEETMPVSRGAAPSGLWSGIRLVAVHPGMRPLFLLIGIFALTVRPVAEMLPAFAEQVFARGATGFASLVSAMGIGALVAGFALSLREALAGLTTVMAVLGIVGALAAATLAITPNYLIALACMGIYGIGVVGKNIAAQTLLQVGVDNTIRGRVFSFYFLVFSATPALGALVIGHLGDRLGIGLPVFVAALIGLAAAIIIFVRRRELARHLEHVL